MTEPNQPNKHDINDLNVLYTDGEAADQEVFAEQRSNLLLVAGEHYSKRQSMFYRRVRDSSSLNQEQKLRLTKNHIQRICKLYANNIISMAPGVGFEPKDEQSIQDKKAADMHHAVWRDLYDRHGIDHLIDQWCDDFIQVGEVHTKIFWDPMKGKVKAFEQKLDEQGNPLHLDAQGQETPEPQDMMGQPHALAPDETLPVFEGAFVFEELYGFNLLRASQAKTLADSPWLCVRKMSDTEDLKFRYKDDPEKLKFFQESAEDTFTVFDGGKGGYKKVKGQSLVREFYFRPCSQYPTGYFYFSTKAGIFEEGPLPGGIFPIVSQSFEKVQTTPRGRSAVKHMRPYQIEINRSASKMAEHQVTLGDDKLLIGNGTKVSAGVGVPGVRAVNYTGSEPGILAGRSGEQYLNYMNSQISELYMVMNVQEDSEAKEMQLDPYALLYRSASQKKKFQRYIKRFEFFLKNVCETTLSLAKIHLPDDQIIYAVGKNEQVNIPEYKNATDICYQIVIESQADDVETKLGKQLSLNHILQYVGPQMKPDDIGKIMRQMPYANFDGCFDDMTMDYDSMENDLLALDRGENPQPHPGDNHPYCIKRLGLRTRKADFKYLDPQIQMNYQNRIQLHTQMEAQRQLQLQRAEQGYIPTGGYLLGCDFFVADPTNPSKTRRARLPSESVQWLVKQLEAQGQTLDQIEALSPADQARIASQMTAQTGGQTIQPRPGVQHSAVSMPQGSTIPGQGGMPSLPTPPMPPQGVSGFHGP